jgi:HEAT repeat protein
MKKTDADRLDDDQVQSFLRDGYIIVDAGLAADFHRGIHAQVSRVFATTGNPGNDILPSVPDLHQVLAQPAVTGALASLLGSDYLLHPHRHCHQNLVGSQGQRMHQDSYEADQNVRHHRVRWLMAFYYPQDVDARMGPSSIVPRTQYLTAEDQHGSADELPLEGRAGTVAIVHYDLWHRAMANTGERDRLMVKFLFTRMSEPHRAAWRHDGAAWASAGNPGDAVCAHLWDWMRGETGAAPNTEGVGDLAGGLTAGVEMDRYDAAYRLGATGDEGVGILMTALREEGSRRVQANIERSHTNPAQFEAAYGLSAAGAAAVGPLTELLADEAWWLRASAADVLGDMGLPAAASTGALSDALTDESEWVRRNAVEALGTIGPSAAVSAGAVARCLTDPSDAVRHNAALALGRIGGGETAALQAAADDANRYVRELAAEALNR